MISTADFSSVPGSGDPRVFWGKASGARDAAGVLPWSDAERAVLREFNALAGASSETLARIDLLGDSRTLVVIGGQQAGLFASPLYILYKAIGVLQWARRLEPLLGRPVLPVFWIASEDHDLEEVRRVRYLDRDGRVRSWIYDGADPGAGVSVFDVPAAPALSGFLDALESETHPTEFKRGALDAWRGLLSASGTLEDFFARALTALLGAHGLILVSPRLLPVRRRAAGIMRREVTQPGESTRLLKAAAEQQEGTRPAIHRRGNEANFFLYRNKVRGKVTLEDSGFRIAHPFTREVIEQTDARALLAELERSPEHFSPNVATRPIVQNQVFPVLAMVAGPGERAYLEMLHEAALPAFFETPAPVILPRAEALLVEPRIERRLVRADIAPEALAAGDWGGIEEALVRAGNHAGVLERLDALRLEQKSAFERFSEFLGAFREKPEVTAALEKTTEAAARALDKFEARLRETISREHAAAGVHRERTLEALHPEGGPQERTLGPLAPFLINYGPRFVPFLLENLDPEQAGTQVLFLSRI